MQKPNDRPTILIVDDSPTNIQVLAEALHTTYGIKVATNGKAALDIARDLDAHPDLILLDVMMPEMDGMEVLEGLKRNGETMHIPVFMLTSKEDSKDIDLAIRKGAVDYIVKPFKAYEVPDMVLKHLENIHGKRAGKLELKNRKTSETKMISEEEISGL